jgi:hypothetical protein
VFKNCPVCSPSVQLKRSAVRFPRSTRCGLARFPAWTSPATHYRGAAMIDLWPLAFLVLMVFVPLFFIFRGVKKRPGQSEKIPDEIITDYELYGSSERFEQDRRDREQ